MTGYYKKEVPGFIVKDYDEAPKVYDENVRKILYWTLNGLWGKTEFSITDQVEFLIDQLERNGYEIKKRQ